MVPQIQWFIIMVPHDFIDFPHIFVAMWRSPIYPIAPGHHRPFSVTAPRVRVKMQDPWPMQRKDVEALMASVGLIWVLHRSLL